MGTPAHDRLGEMIKARREARGIYTVSEAARRSGISRDTWAKIENGMPAKPVTYTKIEDAIAWAHGSCGAVLAGGEPIPADVRPEPPPELDRAQLREALDRFRKAADDLERLINREH